MKLEDMDTARDLIDKRARIISSGKLALAGETIEVGGLRISGGRVAALRSLVQDEVAEQVAAIVAELAEIGVEAPVLDVATELWDSKPEEQLSSMERQRQRESEDHKRGVAAFLSRPRISSLSDDGLDPTFAPPGAIRLSTGSHAPKNAVISMIEVGADFGTFAIPRRDLQSSSKRKSIVEPMP